MNGETDYLEYDMDPRHIFIDERLVSSDMCVYCGSISNTRDHVPSRVLLDKPLPNNLPVVEACDSCNQGFSLDEEYLACLIECVLSGGTNIDSLERPKVRRILSDKPRLRSLLAEARNTNDGGTPMWVPNEARVENVVLKLARGHAAFETGLAHLGEPVTVRCTPFLAMLPAERDEFERAGTGEARLWPEVGSRAFFRACGAGSFAADGWPWIEVQAGRYRYAVDSDSGTSVRMALSEYLACEVQWE